MTPAEQRAVFRSVYLEYRKHHSCLYALRLAYGIAYEALPF